MSFFLTCWATGELYRPEIAGMLASFREHHPDVPAIIGYEPFPQTDWAAMTRRKAEWLKSVWAGFSHLGDMLWIDADARVRRPIAPPAGYEVAAQYYDKLAVTGTVWFRGERIAGMLDDWVTEGNASDAHDEAPFRRACSNHEIEVRSLPRSETSICSTAILGYRGTLEHDSAIVHWNMSRKVSGMIEDWPPSEEERRNAKVPQ